MTLSKVEAERQLTFKKVAKPLGKRLRAVGLEYLRGLVLKHRQQKKAVYLDRKLRVSEAPKYYSTCGHPIPPNALKQHTRYTIRCNVLPASRWAPVTPQAILDEETRWRYNNAILRPYRHGQLPQFWGREEMEAAWKQQGNEEVFLKHELNAVALRLQASKDLTILLEYRTPRLEQLSGEKQLLGYVAYFLDCWQRLHDYKKAPAAKVRAAGAAPAGLIGTDRWDGLLVNYTLADLNNLLVFVSLLETAEPPVVMPGTKPAQWVAVAAALYERHRTRADKAALYRAFFDTYGPAVGSLSSFQREYNEGNEAAQRCYKRTISRLG